MFVNDSNHVFVERAREKEPTIIPIIKPSSLKLSLESPSEVNIFIPVLKLRQHPTNGKIEENAIVGGFTSLDSSQTLSPSFSNIVRYISDQIVHRFSRYV